VREGGELRIRYPIEPYQRSDSTKVEKAAAVLWSERKVLLTARGFFEQHSK
jgi:hypothetical protein